MLGLTKDSSFNDGGTIPPDFTPTSVIWCAITGIGPAKQADTARFSYAQKEATASPELLAALRANDLAGDGPCQLDQQGPVYLMLVNSHDAAAHIRLPEDQCGKYRPETQAALDALPFRTTVTFDVLVSRNDAQ